MKTIIRRTTRATQRNSPNLLAALGVSGVFTTAVLAARAGYESALMITSEEQYREDPLERREKFDLVWKFYISTGVSAAVSVGCIIASTKISARRTAAMAAAYSVGERAFAEYRDKVIEEIGENKERKIRDELAEETLKRNPPGEVVIIEAGTVLACELHTRRYFHTTMQDLRAAQNTINARVVNDAWVTLDELYDILDLEHTKESDRLGWTSDRLLEFEISTVLSPDGRPCIAFAYNYLKPV